MAAKGTTFIEELLKHIFWNDDIALIGDAAGLLGSATAGSLYISLHTAEAATGDAQTSNETAYGSYARIAVTRASGSWTYAAGVMSNAAEVLFAAPTSGSGTITHATIGTAASGAGKILYTKALTASKAISVGDPFSFAIGEIDTSET